jgi:hypothetical protein
MLSLVAMGHLTYRKESYVTPLRLFYGIVFASVFGLVSVASAQTTGSPVAPSGAPALSGQPYVPTHKRHNSKAYGKHYDVYQYSKGGGHSSH